MSESILVFPKKHNSSVSLKLPKPLQELQNLHIRVFPNKNCHQQLISLVECKNFCIGMTFNNRVVVVQGQRVLKSSRHLSRRRWNSLSILSGNTLKINLETDIEELAVELSCFLQVGSKDFNGLISVPSFEVNKEESPDTSFYEAYFARPLRSLQEVELWEPCDKVNICQVPFVEYPTKRELLVCHDCGQNYKIDKKHNNLECTYKFYQWGRTNIFVYFSHSRVTIPPAGWTEWAHRNGSRCLGTFITEWEQGKLENAKLLENPEYYAEKLVEIMVFYNFDGWLLNFESETDDPQGLINWVQMLTALAHSVMGDRACIVWYDSVTHDGKIKWQSQLNYENMEFFNACDGFFTDYHWKEGMPFVSSELADERKWKVYTGTDMHGRGTWGGGRFNTRIGAEDCPTTSVAIFAPAWTWENSNSKKANFHELEKLVWTDVGEVVIDSFGAKVPNRPLKNATNAMEGWTTQVFNGRHWVNVQRPGQFWEVTEDFEFVTGHMWTRRVCEVNLETLGVTNGEVVVGQVSVKGTQPNYQDEFCIKLEVLGQNGEVGESSTGTLKSSEVWDTIKLEVPLHGRKRIRWTESGKDVEFWAGFFGVRFKNTNVLVKKKGKTLLDCFELKTVQQISTWFNECQGPKLFRRGKVIKNTHWNCNRDGDVLPDFKAIASNSFSQEEVFHGTSSLMLKEGVTHLYNCDIDLSGKKVVFVSKGQPKLVLRNGDTELELVSTNSDQEEGWSICEYRLDSHLSRVDVECPGLAFLGGLHIVPLDLPQIRISLESYQIFWHMDSLDKDAYIANIEAELVLEGNRELVRHLDLYEGETWLGRAYTPYIVAKRIEVKDQNAIEVKAESLDGHYVGSTTIEFTKEEALKLYPF